MNLKQCLTTDYFALFSIKREFLVDLDELKTRRKLLLRKTHPDLFTNCTEAEKKLASQYSTLINKAYTVLNNPVKRGEHLCAIMKIDFNMENFEFTNMDFLEKQFEIRGELDQVNMGDVEENALNITKLGSELKKNIGEISIQIDKCFKELESNSETSPNQLKEYLANLAFVEKALLELDNLKRSVI